VTDLSGHLSIIPTLVFNSTVLNFDQTQLFYQLLFFPTLAFYVRFKLQRALTRHWKQRSWWKNILKMKTRTDKHQPSNAWEWRWWKKERNYTSSFHSSLLLFYIGKTLESGSRKEKNYYDGE
jgi:hypothetical protein